MRSLRTRSDDAAARAGRSGASRPRTPRTFGGALLLAAASLAGCEGGPPITSVPPEMELGADVFVYHRPGPLVAAGDTGPRRFVDTLLGAYRSSSVIAEDDLAQLERSLARAGYGQGGTQLATVAPEGHAPVLVATRLGSARAQDVVVVLVRTSGPTGAADAGALVEGARAFLQGGRSRRGQVDLAPHRSLAFVFGETPAASLLAAVTAAGVEPPVAAIAIEAVDAPGDLTMPFVLERAPDPGAWLAVYPDPVLEGDGLPWRTEDGGAGPTALNTWGRMALVDVAKSSRPWLTTEVPHRTGGAQDPCLRAGIPAIRFRHLAPKRELTPHRGQGEAAAALTPDAERARAVVTTIAAALGLANAAPDDMKRWMDSVLLEGRLRLNAPQEEGVPADAEGVPEMLDAWQAWNDGVRSDVRAWCFARERD